MQRLRAARHHPRGSVPPGLCRRGSSSESPASSHRFSESAPAYFQGTLDWYDILTWVGHYGQLWYEGSDNHIYASDPDRSHFRRVLWNYAFNLSLGQFQKPGNWNDPDFIIARDSGLSLAESRSQMALWSIMSAPLILSSDVGKLSPEAIAILANKAVIAIDQDPQG